MEIGNGRWTAVAAAAATGARRLRPDGRTDGRTDGVTAAIRSEGDYAKRSERRRSIIFDAIKFYQNPSSIGDSQRASERAKRGLPCMTSAQNGVGWGNNNHNTTY